MMSSNASISPTSNGRIAVIRHAGRVHVRGKIRRVWRPRYLELCDNGMVHYHELPTIPWIGSEALRIGTEALSGILTPDNSSSHENDWYHVQHHQGGSSSSSNSLKFTLWVLHARIIDVTTLRDLHVGLPRGSFGFLFHGQRQWSKKLDASDAEQPGPRDYFCAVRSLEEAQMWVVALQWAATAASPYRITDRWDSFHGNNNSATEPTTPPPPATKKRNAPTTKQNSNDDSSASPSPRQITNKQQTRVGKIVVTKVAGYHWVRTMPPKSYVPVWEVALELHLLLLRRNTVEEIRVLRTLADLEILMEQLQAHNVEKLSKIRRRLHAVPEHYANLQEIHASLSAVDAMFRELTMEACLVNSTAMKQFWCLSHASGELPSKFLWIAGSPRVYWSLHDPSCVLMRTHRTLAENVRTDEFVKQWLSSAITEKPETATSSEWWILKLSKWTRKPAFLLGGAGLLLLALGPVLRLYQKCIVTIPVRLDLLLLSWYVAAKWGPSLLSSQQALPQTQSRRSIKTGVVKPPSPQGTLPTETPSSSADGMLDDSVIESQSVTTEEELEDDEDDELPNEGETPQRAITPDELSSPLPEYPQNGGESCWSKPNDVLFNVRGITYLQDRVKVPSGPAPFTCRGVDVWMSSTPQSHIARHECVLGGKLDQEDTFLVNFLLPFGNFVAYFGIPKEMPPKIATAWHKFIHGDQQYRDARLKLLPVVVDGPWIVKAAVGPGTHPALLSKVIPLQYYFKHGDENTKSCYEVDVIITASTIAKGILSVVKGHTKHLTIAFCFIIEAATQEELPETALCSFQVHSLHLENCPNLPLDHTMGNSIAG